MIKQYLNKISYKTACLSDLSLLKLAFKISFRKITLIDIDLSLCGTITVAVINFVSLGSTGNTDLKQCNSIQYFLPFNISIWYRIKYQ